MKVEKESLVKLEYETYVDGKLVDSSKMHKPIEVVYGHTDISPELDKNIKGKSEGYSFEIKQTVNSKPVRAEFTYDTFDEDTLELMKRDKSIELELNKFWYPFKVIEANEDANIVVLEYEDPFAGKNVLHKLKIISVQHLDMVKKDVKEKDSEEDED